MKKILFFLPLLLLSGCSHTADPQSVSVTPNETTLDYSNQNLYSVPARVFSMVNAENLNLSNNNLTGAIPAEIRFLRQLKTLNLSNNKMTGLPAEIGQLKKLEVLDVSNNQLTGLPYELGDLTNLKIFNLSGNSYSEKDLQIIREKLPKTQIITL